MTTTTPRIDSTRVLDFVRNLVRGYCNEFGKETYETGPLTILGGLMDTAFIYATAEWTTTEIVIQHVQRLMDFHTDAERARRAKR